MTLYTHEELDVAPVDQDMRLLRAYAFEGNEPAFAQLVDRHGKWIHGMCRRSLHDRELAEDATQAVFLTLSRKASSMPDETRLSGWLYKATRFAIADARKRERRYRRREEVARRLAVERQEQHPVHNTSEAGGQLDLALAALNERDRGVLLMHFFEGLTVRQMGDLLGLSREGAKKRVSRALARLRVKMAAKGSTALTTGLAAVLGAAATEAMPAGLVQTIVAAASNASAGSAAVGGAGLAAAIYRAIVQASQIVSSNLVRGTAAAKLAGATAVVAACVIYTAPRPAAHRVVASGISAAPAAVRAAAVAAPTMPAELAVATVRPAAVRLKAPALTTTVLVRNAAEQAGLQRTAVTQADISNLFSHGPSALRDERAALPDPVVRSDFVRTQSGSDFEQTIWRGSDDSSVGSSAQVATASAAPAASRLTIHTGTNAGSISNAATDAATPATAAGSCSTPTTGAADQAMADQAAVRWGGHDMPGAAPLPPAQMIAAIAAVSGMDEATFPIGAELGATDDAANGDERFGGFPGQLSHGGGLATVLGGSPVFTLPANADSGRHAMPAFAIAGRASITTQSTDLSLGGCDSDDPNSASGTVSLSADAGAVDCSGGLANGMPNIPSLADAGAAGDIRVGNTAAQVSSSSQPLTDSTGIGDRRGGGFGGHGGPGIGLPGDSRDLLHPLVLAPEPSTLAISAGLFGMMLRRRRSRHA